MGLARSNGAAGGGFILAINSERCIASTGATFTTAFLRRGLIFEHGSSWVLPKLVGTSRALDLLLSSDKIDAEARVADRSGRPGGGAGRRPRSRQRLCALTGRQCGTQGHR
ncbi:MAG: enoyl-CoA hydratase-related protein [Pseudomonadota bacterium]